MTTTKNIQENKIYPITVTVYKSPKMYKTGFVYSEEELVTIVDYVLSNNLQYVVAFRLEE